MDGVKDIGDCGDVMEMEKTSKMKVVWTHCQQQIAPMYSESHQMKARPKEDNRKAEETLEG